MNYTLEAVVSLLIFLMLLLTIRVNPPSPDYTLYRYILAEDVWRVLYLKHGPSMFIYFLFDKGDVSLKNDIKRMGEETGLCIEFNIEGFPTTCKNPIIIKYPVVGPINYYLAVGLGGAAGI